MKESTIPILLFILSNIWLFILLLKSSFVEIGYVKRTYIFSIATIASLSSLLFYLYIFKIKQTDFAVIIYQICIILITGYKLIINDLFYKNIVENIFIIRIERIFGVLIIFILFIIIFS